MNFSSQPDLKPEMNMISMVDVVLQLVIFFMLTTTFAYQAYHSGIKVNLPKSQPEKLDADKPITLTITKDNHFYLGQREVTLQNLTQSVKQELGQGDTQDRLVVVRADKEVSHGRVVEVMDLAKQAGIARLAIATEAAPIKR